MRLHRKEPGASFVAVQGGEKLLPPAVRCLKSVVAVLVLDYHTQIPAQG